MFFSFPYSTREQKLSTLFYALPNSFLLAFATLALVRLARARASAEHGRARSILTCSSPERDSPAPRS